MLSGKTRHASHGRRGRTRAWALALAVAVLLIGGWLLGGHRAVAVALGTFLVVEAPLHPADALFVLSGGFPARIFGAVELYRQGYGTFLVLDGGERPAIYRRLVDLGMMVPSEAELGREVAMRLGVPPQAIEILPEANGNTAAGLHSFMRWAQERKIRTAILVTSNYHTRRTHAMFPAITNGEVEAMVYATPYDDFNPKQWWERRGDMVTLLLEYQKLLNWWLVRY